MEDLFTLDIERIIIAHEFVLDKAHKCEYTSARGAYGFVFAIDGTAEYAFSTGERSRIREGEILFLSPKAAYRITPDGAFRHVTVNFTAHGAPDAVPRAHLIAREQAEGTLPIFRRLCELWRTRPVGYRMRAVAYLYELCALFEKASASAPHAHTYARLLRAKEYIDRHFTEQIRIEELARAADMSETNFRREWQRHFGETSMQYRDRVRLSFAKEYLLSGYYNVSEICELCGFCDVSYFVRFFKKHTGISPGAYRHTL